MWSNTLDARRVGNIELEAMANTKVQPRSVSPPSYKPRQLEQFRFDVSRLFCGALVRDIRILGLSYGPDNTEGISFHTLGNLQLLELLLKFSNCVTGSTSTPFGFHIMSAPNNIFHVRKSTKWNRRASNGDSGCYSRTWPSFHKEFIRGKED